jgi:hypothetical protein
VKPCGIIRGFLQLVRPPSIRRCTVRSPAIPAKAIFPIFAGTMDAREKAACRRVRTKTSSFSGLEIAAEIRVAADNSLSLASSRFSKRSHELRNEVLRIFVDRAGKRTGCARKQCSLAIAYCAGGILQGHRGVSVSSASTLARVPRAMCEVDYTRYVACQTTPNAML